MKTQALSGLVLVACLAQLLGALRGLPQAGRACQACSWPGDSVGQSFTRQQPAQEVELVGQVGGRPSALAVLGHLAYVSIGPRLTVWDVSDPAQPALLGRTSLLPGLVEDIDVVGEHAFLSMAAPGLLVVDVADAAAPKVVGHLAIAGSAWDLFVCNQHAYVTTAFAGLRIVDVSDPTAPHEVGSFPGSPSSVHIAADLAYLIESRGLTILDVTDRFSPRLVSATPPYNAWGVTGHNGYAYVCWKDQVMYDYIGGVYVMDVSEPAAPRLVGALDLKGSARDVQVVGRYAYVAAYRRGLSIVDIADPAHPREVGLCTLAAGSSVVAMHGPLAWVVGWIEGSLSVVDVSDVGNPRLVVTWVTPGHAKDVAVAGSLVYVADDGGGLLVGRYPPRGVHDLCQPLLRSG